MALEQRAASPFLDRAPSTFDGSDTRVEYFDADWNGWNRVYRYARATRDENGTTDTIVVLEHRSDGAGWMLVVNLLYIVAAGAVVLAVALVVFATITSKLILRPVLSLQRTGNVSMPNHNNRGRRLGFKKPGR